MNRLLLLDVPIDHEFEDVEDVRLEGPHEGLLTLSWVSHGVPQRVRIPWRPMWKLLNTGRERMLRIRMERMNDDDADP